MFGPCIFSSMVLSELNPVVQHSGVISNPHTTFSNQCRVRPATCRDAQAPCGEANTALPRSAWMRGNGRTDQPKTVPGTHPAIVTVQYGGVIIFTELLTQDNSA